MFDCADDLLAYHLQEVTLSDADRTRMRGRRDSNRDRLRQGLAKAGKPAPIEFVSQGSYAMKTMVWSPDHDYDVDDGVYFRKDDLVGDRGAEMTSLQARQMVRDCIDDGMFSKAPEVRANCVRVFYAAGYHVDVPVYRRVESSCGWNVEYRFELASSSGWRRSDARDVTAWYEGERSRSADARQLRRGNRLLKKYARSRNSWRGTLLSGFGISALVIERFQARLREDVALYDAMVAINDRLSWNLQVAHPVTPGDWITSGSDDAKSRKFRERLTEAIEQLAPLFEAGCDRERALKCWDRVFNTNFFSKRLEDERRASLGAPAIISSAVLYGATASAAAAVSSAGGGRHA